MGKVCEACRRMNHKGCLNPQFVASPTNPINMMKMCCDAEEMLD